VPEEIPRLFAALDQVQIFRALPRKMFWQVEMGAKMSAMDNATRNLAR